MDGYNGAARGGGELCGGHFCERNGLKRTDFEYKKVRRTQWVGGTPGAIGGSHPVDEHRVAITINGVLAHEIPYNPQLETILSQLPEVNLTDDPLRRLSVEEMAEYISRSSQKLITVEQKAEAWIETMLAKHPGVVSGTHMEKGCHHAEMNVICNCAASGVKTDGAWIIITGEPCSLCSKLIHHAGITKVIVIDGGYVGENGLEYLEKNGIAVEKVTGPVDPRATT